MKKIFSIFLIFLSSIIYAEKIQNYTINISLNPDKSVHIKEKIEYNPEDKLVHGIRRYIVKDNVGNFLSFKSKTGIKNFKSNLPFNKSVEFKYDEYRLGDKDIYLPQNKVTIIENSYDIYNIIRTDEDITQIYLNAIGNYWDMDIEKARIILNFDEKSIKNLFVFTGSIGENTNNFVINKNVIETKKTLEANNGLTFKLNLDRNIYKYDNKDVIKHIFITYNTLLNNLSISILFLIILISIVGYKMKSKDIRPIEPMYRIDEKISPSLATMVYNKNINTFKKQYTMLTIIFYSLLSKDLINSHNKYENKDYVLAKGEEIKLEKDYTKFWKRENSKKYSFKNPEIIQERLNTLPPEEKIAVLELFKKKDDILASEKVLRNTNEKVTSYVSNIYRTNVGSKIILPSILVVICAIISFILSIIFQEINISIIVVVILAIINILISTNLYKFKKEGLDIIRNIKGFIMYFDMAEKNIFNTFNTQEEMMQYAKSMFPYAIALGIRKKFMKLLDEAIKAKGYDRYTIYDGMYYGYLYNFSNINNKIYDSTKPIIKNSNSSYGGFSSGSGGYSGGGFSGGGGSSW